MEQTAKRPAWWAQTVLAWGVGSVLLVLMQAVIRLSPMAVDALRSDLDWVHWGFLGVWVPFMLWSEAYRGFHKKFSPRVAARALYLVDHPRWWRLLLAAPFCMGLFHATRRRLITSWCVLGGIVVLVAGVRHLHQPWRGLVDVGVVLGLFAGALSVLWWGMLASGGGLQVDPEVP